MNKAEQVIEKIAADHKNHKDKKPEAGYFARQNMAMRATRAGDSGINMLVNKSEFIGDNLKAQLVGSAGGAVVGAGAGAGVARFTSIGKKVQHLGFKTKYGLPVAIGAAALSLAGQIGGAHSHRKDYLKKRGINYNYLGVTSSTSAAKKRYLAKKWKGGGYDDTKKTAGIFSVVSKVLSKAVTKVKPIVAKVKPVVEKQVAKVKPMVAKAKPVVEKQVTKAKSMGKSYASSVKSDFATAKRLTFTSKGKLVKGLGYHDRVQRNKAFVGLAGRVVLPAYVAGDLLT